jgi:predicted DsbA family dithiol-disulfide isomerase
MTDNPTALPTEDAGDAMNTAELETMERYGITRVPAAVYLVGPYRYSKLADALAEAKRREIAF